MSNTKKNSQFFEWCVPTLLGLAGVLSINPYFLWLLRGGQLAAAAGLSIIAIAWQISRRGICWPPRTETIGVALLIIYLGYLTALTRMDGSHSKWVAVIPFLVAIATLSDESREKCLEAFITIFAITLIPAIVIWCLVIVNFPVEFHSVPYANPQMTSAAGGGLLYMPGVIFIEGNSVVLKTGGTLFRLCAIYDEPGTVGTIAALALAAVRFKINDWRYAILFIGGLASLSIAFIVMAIIGYSTAAILSRRLGRLLLLPPLIVAFALSMGWIDPSATVGSTSNVTIIAPKKNEQQAQTLWEPVSDLLSSIPWFNSLRSTTTTRSKEENNEYRASRRKLLAGFNLRTPGAFDDRSNIGMRELLRVYWKSNWKTRMLGIHSDASTIDPTSQVVWRILTDSGIVGFSLLLAGCATIVFSIWHRRGYSSYAILCIAIFVLSCYQRPVIWLPYTLLILICGVHTASEPRRLINGPPGQHV